MRSRRAQGVPKRAEMERSLAALCTEHDATHQRSATRHQGGAATVHPRRHRGDITVQTPGRTAATRLAWKMQNRWQCEVRTILRNPHDTPPVRAPGRVARNHETGAATT